MMPQWHYASLTGPAFSLGHSSSPQSRTLLAIQLYVALDCCFNGVHPSNPFRYMDYYSLSDPRWM